MEIAQDVYIGVFAMGNRMASYKYIQPGVTEITLLNPGGYAVGHINQLEKAEGCCRYFVETGNIPSGWYSVLGECHCEVCSNK